MITRIFDPCGYKGLAPCLPLFTGDIAHVVIRNRGKALIKNCLKFIVKAGPGDTVEKNLSFDALKRTASAIAWVFMRPEKFLAISGIQQNHISLKDSRIIPDQLSIGMNFRTVMVC